MQFKNITIQVAVAVVVATCFFGCSELQENSKPRLDGHNKLAIQDAKIKLETGFENPPHASRPDLYWYWLDNYISKEGITKDLEAMARVGIGRAMIGNIEINHEQNGNVKVYSDEWWSLLKHALLEADRVGVDIGLFNSSGWSQSGGPWVKPEQSMRYLTYSETQIQGGGGVAVTLPPPSENFQDVAVLAFPTPEADSESLSRYAPVISSRSGRDFSALFDGSLKTQIPLLQGQADVIINLSVKDDFTLRSIEIHPNDHPIKFKLIVQVKSDAGEYQTIKSIDVARELPTKQTGPMTAGVIVEAIGSVVSKSFRLILRDIESDGGKLTEISMLGSERVNRATEKQLGSLWQAGLPMSDAYLWPEFDAAIEQRFLVEPQKVIDISEYLSAEGVLNWEAPVGNWTVLRTGMSPTGVENTPTSKEGRGLEVDKMNAQWVRNHFNSFIGEVLARIEPENRKALTTVVADSYEVGPQNWTDDLRQVFRDRLGYDAVRWLPVLSGRVVGSREQSNKFLWDLRRLVADRIATEYVGGLRKASEEQGLKLWLENYGHFGFPGEFLQYGGQSNEVAGEFWNLGDMGSVAIRSAASAGHIYGKQRISSEAFTSIGSTWRQDPWSLKLLGDWAMAEGANHFVLHVYIHQPEELAPGIATWFGIEFNRHNTWFEYSSAWVDYYRRAHFLLQAGHNVADIAYFIGEDTPIMTGLFSSDMLKDSSLEGGDPNENLVINKPALPEGYEYDFINAEVIHQRLEIDQGEFVLPEGGRYKIIVLPERQTMRPELIKRLYELVNNGGAIYGSAPRRSPSLSDYPDADLLVSQMAAGMWGNCDGSKILSVRLGKGRIFCGGGLERALAEINSIPDVDNIDVKKIYWSHRTSEDVEIYFISNQSNETVEFSPRFRQARGKPEFWNPVTGKRKPLPEYSRISGRTSIPLKLYPRQSGFVVFRDTSSAVKGEINFPEMASLQDLSTQWQVTFDPSAGGVGLTDFETLTDWTINTNDNIRHYSGTATYRKTIEVKTPPDELVYLDLGALHGMAKVYVNGTDLGIVWSAPWRLDVTSVIKPGKNSIEIDVVNNWANRLIGDASKQEEDRITWTTFQGVTKDTALVPSGLLGPVQLLTMHKQ